MVPKDLLERADEIDASVFVRLNERVRDGEALMTCPFSGGIFSLLEPSSTSLCDVLMRLGLGKTPE